MNAKSPADENVPAASINRERVETSVEFTFSADRCVVFAHCAGRATRYLATAVQACGDERRVGREEIIGSISGRTRSRRRLLAGRLRKSRSRRLQGDRDRIIGKSADRPLKRVEEFFEPLDQ